MELQGKYGTAKVYTDVIEQTAISQIIELLNQPFADGANVRIMSDVHAGKGCTIGTTMKINGKVCPNLVGVDIGCLDKDTEILTPSGWIKINEYDQEQILVFDKNSSRAYFEYPKNYIKLPTEEFYHLHHTKGLDQVVSDEHKILFYRGTKGRGFQAVDYMARDFVEKHNSLGKGLQGGFKASFIYGGEGVDFSDDELRLLVAISADGCLRWENENGKYFDFHLRKSRKIERLIAILDKLGILYNHRVEANNSSSITFYAAPKFTKDLTLLYGGDQHQLAIVKEECFLWDGTIDEERDHYFYSSTDKRNSDVIQFVIAAQDIRAGMYTQVSNNENWSNVYQVYPTKNNIVGMSPTKIDKVKSKDGLKYCFTTSTGYFVARRNNNIFITGNCGVLVVRTPYSVELMSMEGLDKVIREFIPSGFSTREQAEQMAWQEKFLSENLNCWDQIKNKERIYASLGTLGGGNHFIELNKDREGKAVLVIHTGSRNLGTQVAKIYQDRAIKECASNEEVVKEGIAALKAAGRQADIAAFIAQEKAKSISVPDNLAYLQGESMREYLEDMAAVQEWAWRNREQIANTILRESWSTDLSSYSHFQTVHNFIDKNWILRKGAVSADTGEHLIIPLNMRDGSLLCVGRGNEDWNKSAPHGAGRLMSRGQAKRELSMADFTREMSDVYSTSVSESTLDEAPMAYKDMESIVSNIGDTVHIIERIVPVYNFKASDVTD